MRRFVFLLFPVLFLVSCSTHQERAIVIESFRNLTEIPSASGVEVINSEIWMVGDDSPFLYQFDKELNLINKYQISSIDTMKGKRVVKSEKADFESLARIGDSLLILSSGSVKGSRDTLVIFSLSNKDIILKTNVRSLFNQYLTISDTNNEVNFEGLVRANKNIYFFNRGNLSGNNDVFRIPITDFNTYLERKVRVNWSLVRFHLPPIGNFLSGFSGACLSQDGQYLYFTSSVEAANDVYNDGEVLGSFIGRIHFESQEIKYWPLKENDQFVKTKLESISIIETGTDFIRFVCTSDNDDGTSGVYHLKLNLKFESYE